MAQNTESVVNLNVAIPKALDRAIEEAAFKRETTKKAVVELALRTFLKIPARAA